MKKGFTLVEMLIVVVVLVTLMSITFRLSSLGDDQRDRATTISRLQRIENCLSGFYAAYGTYPPVRDHGIREFCSIQGDESNGGDVANGVQSGQSVSLDLGWYEETGDHGISKDEAKRDWYRVAAVCRVQPVAAMSLIPAGIYEMERQLAAIRGETTTFDDRYTTNPGREYDNTADWRRCQLFMFGLMSYLLPRYPLMMTAGDDAGQIFENSRQWTDNNSLPCNQLDGSHPWTWSDILKAMKKYHQDGGTMERMGGDELQIAQSVFLSPSHAVCARWMPNLEKCCYSYFGSTKFFGIEISAGNTQELERRGEGKDEYGKSGDKNSPYSLSIVTVLDAWGSELFYYSPPPYQSYVLWSAGPNKRTFPPWILRESYTGKKAQCIGAWIADDIVNMSH